MRGGVGGGNLNGDKLTCPACGTPVHEVYFADEVQRWRCMGCGRIFSGLEYEAANGELSRVRVWRRGAALERSKAGAVT